MTRTGEILFVDSNILVCFLDVAHPHHERVMAMVRQWRNEDLRFAISPQVIGETFRTLTSHSYTSGPLKAKTFRPLAERVKASPSVLVVSPGEPAIDFALDAAVKLDISSARVYDLILYGTMREHGIARIATINVKHFSGLDGIEVVEIP